MQHWVPFALSVSQRPVLLEGEVELVLVQDVAFYDGDSASPVHEGGLLRVTSHRVLYCGPTANIALSLQLVQDVEKQAGFFTRHPKLKLVVTASPPGFVRLSFRAGGLDEAQSAIASAQRRAAWKGGAGTAATAAASVAAKPRVFDPLAAGVGAAERRIADMQRETRENLDVAFRDIQELKSRALEMVQLAKRLSVHLQQRSADGGGGGDADAQVRFSSVAQKIGFVSPVTRATAGALYDTELARQICELLLPHVRATGGMLLLADAYGLVNRARGTALLSPDDMRRACDAWTSLGLPLQLRTFPSGVLAVQEASAGADATAERVCAALTAASEQRGAPVGWTVQEVSARLQLPIAVAREQLLASEGAGALVRDDSAEGVRFYVNTWLSADRSRQAT